MSPRFILTRAWDIICTINIVRSGNNHFSLWAVLRDKQKFAVLFIVCWCVWFCASLNDWYLGTGCETEGLENCSKYVCVYSMFSLISTSWSVISMPAPQNWLIKDTEWSDSRKFMLISAPSAQPPFWDTISACLNIQISRYPFPFLDFSPTLSSICYLLLTVKREGKHVPMALVEHESGSVGQNDKMYTINRHRVA